MAVRALLFDLDDTLLETFLSHNASLRLSCRRAAEIYPAWTAERLEEAFRRAYRLLEARMESGSLKYESQVMFRTHTWEETLRSCELDPAVGEHLARVYLDERRRRYQLYDDVPVVLPRLAERFELVLVTNGLGDLQREKIEAVGLGRWFDRIVISGEVGSWKPDGAIFRHALSLVGAAPGEAVMVGDSLERDIHGARSAGMRTVWMRRYPHLKPIAGIEPHVTAVDAHGVVEALAAWD